MKRNNMTFELWANAKTGTWSLIGYPSESMSCLFLSGDSAKGSLLIKSDNI